MRYRLNKGAPNAKTHIAVEFRILLQEPLKREELLSDALHLVQLVSRNDHLHARVFFSKRIDPFGHGGVPPLDREALHVDPDRERRNAHDAVVKNDGLWRSFQPQNTEYALSEVTGVRLSLEADEVRTEHTPQQILSVYTPTK